MKPSRLPVRVDLMPREAREPSAGPLLQPNEVIALALNAIPYEWWRRLPLSETSEPVRTILDGIHRGGWKIVPR